jgi:hypothetical protein
MNEHPSDAEAEQALKVEAIELFTREKRKTVVKDSSYCTIREAKRFAQEQAKWAVNDLRKEIIEPRLNAFAEATNAAAERMELAAAAATQVISSLSREVLSLRQALDAVEDELVRRTWRDRWRRLRERVAAFFIRAQR